MTKARLAWVPVTIMAGMFAASGLQTTFGRDVAAQVATPAAEVGILDARDGLPECVEAEPGAVPAGVDAASVYAINSAESAARYLVTEELAGVGANEVIGETNAIIGNILFDAGGASLPCSQFDVDLRTLETDEARRDNYLRGNTLETDTYPLATFVLRHVEGVDGPVPVGEAVTIILIGDLTFHGETRLAAWEATVTKEAANLTGSATTTFTFPDFNIEKPIVGPVVGIGDEVTLEIDLVAAPAG
ncbi:MAG: YceI family protein [Chloroflexota bacterium]|nr:YceI family protein [Chloroflexota bacterium]